MSRRRGASDRGRAARRFNQRIHMSNRFGGNLAVDHFLLQRGNSFDNTTFKA